MVNKHIRTYSFRSPWIEILLKQKCQKGNCHQIYIYILRWTFRPDGLAHKELSIYKESHWPQSLALLLLEKNPWKNHLKLPEPLPLETLPPWTQKAESFRQPLATIQRRVQGRENPLRSLRVLLILPSGMADRGPGDHEGARSRSLACSFCFIKQQSAIFRDPESTADRRDGKGRNWCAIKKLYYFFISSRRISPWFECRPSGERNLEREGEKEVEWVGVKSQRHIRASLSQRGTPYSTGRLNNWILRDKISSSIILTCHQHFSHSIFLYINHFICQ